MSDKGLTCYRTACPNAANVLGYNRITHGLYCLGCADLIGASQPLDVSPYFPMRFSLASIDGGGYVRGHIRYRPALTPPTP